MTNYVQSNTQKKGLTVKDLITIGVFTALIYVCNLLGGTIFAITPTLTFYFLYLFLIYHQHLKKPSYFPSLSFCCIKRHKICNRRNI